MKVGPLSEIKPYKVRESIVTQLHEPDTVIALQDYAALKAYIAVVLANRGYIITYSGYGKGEYAVKLLIGDKMGTAIFYRGSYADCAYFALMQPPLEDGHEAFEEEIDNG